MEPEQERWYSIHGRIRRSTWVLRVFGGGALMGVSVAGLAAVSASLGHGRHGDGASLIMVPVLGMVLAFVVFRFIQDIKRLHDIGQSGFLVICAFIPLINLIYLLFLIFADGQPYTNQYGRDPKGRGSDLDADAVADVFR